MDACNQAIVDLATSTAWLDMRQNFNRVISVGLPPRMMELHKKFARVKVADLPKMPQELSELLRQLNQSAAQNQG